ncbi:terminase large subunit [Maritimibacter sp. DP1N21-5]|uniref:terminase large subunit n=1 Tax=Maritimibacter sp. DP1N21-5 TaxID=2836867 RepID=UPI0021062D23|nr:terminase large subunit [Maritimibacter sp. DP1N21-5]
MGELIRSAAWDTALPDWEDRLVQGLSLIPPLPLFEQVADKAVAVFKRLRIPDMIGKPTFGATAEDWVFDFVRVVFGSYDPDTKKRMIREFFLLIPKKNTKTTIAAGIMVTAAILNERPEAELLFVAPTQEVAKTAFSQAKGMIKADARLDADLGEGGIFKIRDHKRTIEHLVTGAELKIVSADTDVVTGTKATYVLVDETHVLGAKPKAPDIFTELRGGLASRPDGFFLQITTQSKEEPRGQWKAELATARQVRDGTLKLPMLAVLYELPEKMAKAEAWRDEKTWGMVNPNLERSVSIEFLQDEWRKAQGRGKEAEALFASQHLNVEIGLGLHSERWVGADYWQKLVDPGLADLYALMERSEVVVVGGDMGGADDLSALAFLGREKKTRRLLHWGRAWVSPDALTRRKEIAPILEEFEADGDLVIEPDSEEHARQMAELVTIPRDAALYPEAGFVGLDPHGVAALLDELEAAGFSPEAFYGVGQGYKLNGAIKGLERRFLDGRFRHGGQGIMRWSIGNAKAETRGNNTIINKARAGACKIDPLIALFNAAILMDLNPVAAGGGINSYFEALGA